MYVLVGLGAAGVQIIDPLKSDLEDQVDVFYAAITEDEREGLQKVNLIDGVELENIPKRTVLQGPSPLSVDLESASVLEYWRRYRDEIAWRILAGLESHMRSMDVQSVGALDFFIIVDAHSPVSLVASDFIKSIIAGRKKFSSISPLLLQRFTICLVHGKRTDSPYIYPVLESLTEFQKLPDSGISVFLLDTDDVSPHVDLDDIVEMTRQWIILVLKGNLKKEDSYDGVGSFGLVRRSLPISPFIEYLGYKWTERCLEDFIGETNSEQKRLNIIDLPKFASVAKVDIPCTTNLISGSKLGKRLPDDVYPEKIIIDELSIKDPEAISEMRNRMKKILSVDMPTIERTIRSNAEIEKKQFVEQIREHVSELLGMFGIKGTIRKIESLIKKIENEAEKAQKQISVAKERMDATLDFGEEQWLYEASFATIASFIIALLLYITVWSKFGINIIFSILAPLSFVFGIVFVLIVVRLVNVGKRSNSLYSTIDSSGVALALLLAIMVVIPIISWHLLFRSLPLSAVLYLIVPFVLLSFVVLHFLGEIALLFRIIGLPGFAGMSKDIRLSLSYKDAEDKVHAYIETFDSWMFLKRAFVITVLAGTVAFIKEAQKSIPFFDFLSIIKLPFYMYLAFEAAFVALVIGLVYTFVLYIWSLRNMQKYKQAWPVGTSVFFQRVLFPALLVFGMIKGLHFWAPVFLLSLYPDVRNTIGILILIYLLIVGLLDIARANQIFKEWIRWFELNQCWSLYGTLWKSILEIYKYWLNEFTTLINNLKAIENHAETEKNTLRQLAEQTKRAAFSPPRYSVGYLHVENIWQHWEKKYLEPDEQVIKATRAWFGDIFKNKISIRSLRNRVKTLIDKNHINDKLKKEFSVYRYFLEMDRKHGLSGSLTYDSDEWTKVWNIIPALPFENWNMLLRDGSRPRWDCKDSMTRRVYLGIPLSLKGNSAFRDAIKRVVAGAISDFDETEEALSVVQYKVNVFSYEDIIYNRVQICPRLAKWKQATENARQSGREDTT